MRRWMLPLAVLLSVLTIGAARVVPAPIDGVTLDNDGFATKARVAAQLSALEALPHEPTARIVLDPATAPADYARAITAFAPHAYLMAELVDSSSLKSTSAATYHSKTASFLASFGSSVDIWEVGNEVNGNWTGSYASVAAKIADAYNQVHAAGDATALTLYENSWAPNHCGDGSAELTPQQFSNQYVSPAMRAGLDFVLLSWYPTQCSGLSHLDVPASTIASEVSALHALYPNARIGFGEIGLPNKVSAGTLAKAQSIVRYYYGLGGMPSYYVGGGFWWYFAEDAVPTSKPMFAALHDAME